MSSASTPLGDLKILLVEDSQILQKVLSLMIKKLGYEVTIANNGLEAIAAVEKQHYDLIFMDIQMPEMDGLTATRHIKQHYPNSPKIVAVTANTLSGDREKCLKVGMDNYLSKPVHIDQLQQMINLYAPRI